jgi:hypothetical protein
LSSRWWEIFIHIALKAVVISYRDKGMNGIVDWDVQVHKIGDGLSFKQASILRRRWFEWLISFTWDGVLGF